MEGVVCYLNCKVNIIRIFTYTISSALRFGSTNFSIARKTAISKVRAISLYQKKLSKSIARNKREKKKTSETFHKTVPFPKTQISVELHVLSVPSGIQTQ
jgi:hypothetical protein